jgi:hypothetical protein
MTKLYKQPEEIKVDETPLTSPVFLKESVGALYLDMNAPTAVPSGKPINFVEQFRYILVEGSPASAGAFVPGAIYKITTVGTTNFTLVGARNSTLGTYFVATGVGSGTGAATVYTVRLYFYIPQFDIWKYISLT